MPLGKRWIGCMLIGIGLMLFGVLAPALAGMVRLRGPCRWHRPGPAKPNHRQVARRNHQIRPFQGGLLLPSTVAWSQQKTGSIWMPCGGPTSRVLWSVLKR